MTTDSKSNTKNKERVPRDHHDIERDSADPSVMAVNNLSSKDHPDASDGDLQLFSKALSGNGDNGKPMGAPREHEIDMRIARDGTWYYMGSPINRKPLVKLFSSVLNRDDNGRYFLRTPVEKAWISVDDVPFTAVEMQTRGQGDNGVLTFRTNIDEWVSMDAEHPLRVEVDDETGEPAPYILVRDNLEALIVRSVFYDLVELADMQEGAEGGQTLSVSSNGVRFELGNIDG